MTLPRTQGPEWEAAQATPWVSVNEALRIMDGFTCYTSVNDRDLQAPTGSFADGTRYWVKAPGTGAWAGHDNDIAIALGADASNGWLFVDISNDGSEIWVRDENKKFRFVDSAWVEITDSISTLDGLLDVDTTGVADGYIITYDLSNGLWYAASPATLVTTNFASSAEVRAGTVSTKAIAPDQLIASAVPQTLNDSGGAIPWDMSLGYNAVVTLDGNHAFSAPSNPKRGITYTLEIIQDGTGSRVPSFNTAFKFGEAGTPVLSTAAGKRDFVFLYCYDASTPEFRCTFNKDG